MKSTRRLRAMALVLILAGGLAHFSLNAQTSPAAGSTGTTSSPPSGNYPGSGSSPQPGVPPPALAPSGQTPGSGNGGVTNTPPSGVTPGTGASPTPSAPGGSASGPPPAPPYTGH